MTWARVLALLSSAVIGVSGCGGRDDAKGPEKRPRLVVSAAASMAGALQRCSPRFTQARVRLSLAGSDELAAQIRRGIRPDVYAAANTALAERLEEEGLLEKPIRFATNELVVALPANSELESIRDLASKGVTLAIGSESVPIGAYTRDVLSRLPPGEGEAILANVRSSEPDVRGIVGKLTQGAADAGFAYGTDVVASRGRLRSLPLPPGLQPAVAYAAGVVRGAREPERARRYIRGLVAGGCHAALRAAGFGPAR